MMHQDSGAPAARTNSPRPNFTRTLEVTSQIYCAVVCVSVKYCDGHVIVLTTMSSIDGRVTLRCLVFSCATAGLHYIPIALLFIEQCTAATSMHSIMHCIGLKTTGWLVGRSVYLITRLDYSIILRCHSPRRRAHCISRAVAHTGLLCKSVNKNLILACALCRSVCTYTRLKTCRIYFCVQ